VQLVKYSSHFKLGAISWNRQPARRSIPGTSFRKRTLPKRYERLVHSLAPDPHPRIHARRNGGRTARKRLSGRPLRNIANDSEGSPAPVRGPGPVGRSRPTTVAQVAAADSSDSEKPDLGSPGEAPGFVLAGIPFRGRYLMDPHLQKREHDVLPLPVAVRPPKGFGRSSEFRRSTKSCQRPDSAAGEMELDLAKSKFSGPAPKSQTRTYDVAGDSVNLTSKGVSTEGKPTAVQLNGALLCRYEGLSPAHRHARAVDIELVESAVGIVPGAV
jgi:hypothetical protein